MADIQGPVAQRDPELTQDDLTMAAVAHALGAFTSFVGPALLYFAYDGRSRFVQFHALQSMAIQAIAAGVFIGATIITCGVGILAVPPLAVALVIAEIVYATRAYEGQWVSYPRLEGVGANLRPEALPPAP